MIKNIFIFIVVSIFVVFIVQYFLEKYIETDEQQTSEQTEFKRDLTDSLNQLSTLSECNSTSQNISDVTQCLRSKSEGAYNKIEKYQNIEGCISEIAIEVISITKLVNDFSDLSNKIVESNENIEDNKIKASQTLDAISSKINTISELNSQDVCLLNKIK